MKRAVPLLTVGMADASVLHSAEVAHFTHESRCFLFAYVISALCSRVHARCAVEAAAGLARSRLCHAESRTAKARSDDVARHRGGKARPRNTPGRGVAHR